MPGKKWEWRDPNKVAEDPNATPGTCKPNPLLSSALQYPLAGTSSTSSVISANTPTNDMSKVVLNENFFFIIYFSHGVMVYLAEMCQVKCGTNNEFLLLMVHHHQLIVC